jgi:iron complex transport system substrate-binding protein
MKKKAISIFLAAAVVVSLAVCESNSSKVSAEMNVEETSGEQNSESITITALNAAGEPAEVTVPYDPQRIAILDLAALDIMDNLGLGDRVVGSASTTLDYLEEYTTREDVVNLGNIKEADMEAVMSCEPDVIFIGGRLSSSYDALCEIAPVVYLATDTELGVVESTRKNAETIASIFGKEAEVEEKFDGFDERIAALQEIAEGKTAVVGMATSGSFNVLGNSGRCSIIGVEIGYDNLCAETESSYGNQEGSGKGQGNGSESAHGNEASFELIVSLNPDYIFVLDRDAAIGTNGAQLAQEIMENELVMSTEAYQNGNMIILENPAAWYTAEGGITALDMMLTDLENALIK